MTLADVRQKWNRRHAAKLEEGGAPIANPLALRFAPHIQGGTLLDAACGMGAGTAALLEKMDRVIGVDLSETALAASRRYFGDDPRILWVQGDVSRMPWPGDYFSVVCAFGFTDWAFIHRVPSLVRPGGWFLYQGFSPRQIALKPTLNVEWTSTPQTIAKGFSGWDMPVCEESEASPFRVSFAAQRPV